MFSNKTYPDNWTNLSKQLLAFTGTITNDGDLLMFTLNNIDYRVTEDSYYTSETISIRDPETTHFWINIHNYLPSMKKIIRHIGKQYGIQREQHYTDQQLKEKSRAEQILFGVPQ